MADDTSLPELILGYCRLVGGLVEPPAYGIYEVLLPDGVASRWRVDALQRFIFSLEAASGTAGVDITFLNYGHPLVETVVNELRQQSANGVFYVNNVRLEKPGLFAVIEKSLRVANARLSPAWGVVERRRMYHYVRFNFKASLISDEKRELILPVWMNLQGGYAVRGSEMERLAILDAENQFKHLDPASPTWLAAEPLSPEAVRDLLERASRAARVELAPNLENLQRRIKRYLELDRARLQQYYDELQRDLEKRLHKVAEDDDRRPGLEAKLVALAAERQSKLADAEQKYRLRVELELINLAVIAQPKIDLSVEIKKRTATVERQVVWDPLLHAVEPLICDVCGQPGEELSLCEEGHLAHTGCLAPQCVECKRTYCQKCADKVQTCVVCNRPVCVHSLSRCPECKRATCHEHRGDCHADNGEPRQLLAEEKPLPTGLPQAKAVTVLKEVVKPSSVEKSNSKKEISKGKPSVVKTPVAPKSVRSPQQVTGDSIEVYTEAAQGVVTAYVYAKKREIAARTWELTQKGITVYCKCEKNWLCREHGLIYRPAVDVKIETQLMMFINSLKSEYRVPEKKIHFFRIRLDASFADRRLILLGQWKNTDLLEQARQGFDRLPKDGKR